MVVIFKTNFNTSAQAYFMLFSTDLKQASDQIIKYYSQRFKIELKCRDAKQFWGREDFMNVQESAVTNATNFSLHSRS